MSYSESNAAGYCHQVVVFDPNNVDTTHVLFNANKDKEMQRNLRGRRPGLIRHFELLDIHELGQANENSTAHSREHGQGPAHSL